MADTLVGDFFVEVEVVIADALVGELRVDVEVEVEIEIFLFEVVGLSSESRSVNVFAASVSGLLAE
jgi:hypothetical protein